MQTICPLLIRASFIGRTYHDFQLEFQSPVDNCTNDASQNPLLIQFTRVLNATLNETTYALYDRTDSNVALPQLQVFHNDHVDLCIRSAVDRNQSDLVCHEFYMITMLSSNTTYWPLLMIFGYVFVLLIAMFGSLLSNLFHKLTKTIFSGSITKKVIKQNQNARSFIPIAAIRQNHQKKLTEKNEILNTMDTIAKEYRPRRHINPFIVRAQELHGEINPMYK